MATTIFIFLLDYVPGFETAFKSSLQNLNENITIDICDSRLLNEILKIQEFNSVYRDLHHENISRNYIDKLSPYQALFDMKNSAEGYNYRIGISALNIFHDKIAREYFPAQAPFLVAIFETLSNITAQTCSGVLLTKNWVLTASTCINVLPYLYRNGSATGRSYHTVIANSTNPLSDGSVHNVTDVVLYPKKRVPLALMRINPSIEVKPLQLYNSNFMDNLQTMVYGWSIYKNENGSDVMKTSIVESTARKCDANHAIKGTHSLLCLIARKPTNEYKMNSGGPVLVLRHKKVYLLGIALVDRISFVVPLNHYYGWINYILKQYCIFYFIRLCQKSFIITYVFLTIEFPIKFLLYSNLIITI
ncbi:granzyme K-like [Pieris napi]|uniref:granzyme K-like n=1 Tax=Pieris napi TaxID=78633 RepID=UPI001FB93C45|nr:granzyme K-like [Pieris napi]